MCKLNFIILFFLLICFKKANCFKFCSGLNNNTNLEKTHSHIYNNFEPNYIIEKNTLQDDNLLQKMKELFFERCDKSELAKKRNIYKKCINNYGAQEVFLNTEDNFKISSLFFERENSPINIVYVTGYFHDKTPTKEWCAPFAELFPKFNILTYDWRSFGDSQGKRSKWFKNDFGDEAYRDIFAAINFLRKKNNKPIVLVGFCFGAAMALKATLLAQKRLSLGDSKNYLPDALVLNSIFTSFENQFNRAIFAENRWHRRLIMKLFNQIGLTKYFLNRTTSGSLFNLKPIDDVLKLNIPCYFEHFIDDPFAIIDEAFQVFNKVNSYKEFMISSIGRHVRIHTVAPYQYKKCFISFLKNANII